MLLYCTSSAAFVFRKERDNMVQAINAKLQQVASELVFFFVFLAGVFFFLSFFFVSWNSVSVNC